MQLFEEPLTPEQKAGFAALADDIECGAKLHPQGRGNLIYHSGSSPSHFRTCALGATWECRLIQEGVTDQQERYERMQALTNNQYDQIVKPYGLDNLIFDRNPEPAAMTGGYIDTFGFTVVNVIWRMNDNLHMTREQIAAWLRTLD